jgi:fructokinase
MMIISCGETLIDMIPIQGANGEQGFQPLVGGALFNTAIGLGRLGAEVAMISGISNDLFGQQLEQALAASHVQTNLLVRSDLPTTLAFVRLNNGHADYTFYDENTAGRNIQLDDIQPLPEHANCLYFGGISLISEPCADTYCALAEREGANRVIMLDPNIRPSFISDEGVYRRRLERMIAVADIVKVSDEDLDWLVPGHKAIADKITRLRKSPAQLFIVTRGADSCMAYGAQGLFVEQPVQTAKVVDTVGAGDTFNSGLLASLSQQGHLTKASLPLIQHEQISTALAYGAKVAAVTVTRAGANPPWLNDLN